jgi:hypothetical protein
MSGAANKAGPGSEMGSGDSFLRLSGSGWFEGECRIGMVLRCF